VSDAVLITLIICITLVGLSWAGRSKK
jgi:hypothetical protein